MSTVSHWASQLMGESCDGDVVVVGAQAKGDAMMRKMGMLYM